MKEKKWAHRGAGRWIALLLCVAMIAGGCQIPAKSTAQEEKTAAVQVQEKTDRMTGKGDAATPVAQHGALRVDGTDLVDSRGQKFQLKGVSTHGIAWFPQYVNKDAFQTLRDQYHANAIRLAMYCNANDGYGPDVVKKVQEGVQYATELGMYVIIDWHLLTDGNPNRRKKAAKKFFTKMAKAYASQDNVLYEICNEPHGNVTWNKHIKPYAKAMLKTIRKYDKNAVVIVGTPTWSQDVDLVVKSPLKGQKNIMYALHFYAATHKDAIRNKLITAHKKGLPVIVSEFSICDASGNGALDKASANQWMKLLNKYNISFFAWSLCNKNESSALIAPNCNKTSGWEKSDFSAAGKWFINQLK